MIDPLNPPWQSTLPPFLQRETPSDAVQLIPESESYAGLTYHHDRQWWTCRTCKKVRQTASGARIAAPFYACECTAKKTPETDPRGDVREPDSWIPKDHPDVIQLYERREAVDRIERFGKAIEDREAIDDAERPCPTVHSTEAIDRVVAQYETVAIDVPWTYLRDGKVVESTRKGPPDRRIQRTVYRGTGRRITSGLNGCRWGRRHDDDPGDYHQMKLLWPEEQSETITFGDQLRKGRVGPPDRRQEYVSGGLPYQGERRRGLEHGRRCDDSATPQRRSCGCIARGPTRQECVQCAPPLTAGGGVVQENSNSALRRKIRAEIIEEVTRFLTGDDD